MKSFIEILNENKVIKGGNADIDVNGNADWKQGKCPWSEKDGKKHKCAEKGVSICDYFVKFGGQHIDDITCSYPNK